ncbi:hypothetical protein [Thalassococcus sp. S3]|nr:hypothetical protein [Thalassococcus sp. S3]
MPDPGEALTRYHAHRASLRARRLNLRPPGEEGTAPSPFQQAQDPTS